jgi:ribosomal protein S12 methylthiotransferase
VFKLPSVGFISLGCPKALVDSERIITKLRQNGYDISPDYHASDVVIVNTCGFIDSAKAESLDAIGEAINENGRVIVTGCLGANAEQIQKKHPQVLSVTGPQQYEQVVDAVLKHAPISTTHNPYTDLIPPQGIKLTPKHYAYLKISEGCNHHCSFCIIPSMRGKLVSRPVDNVMQEAQTLVDAGVKELLIISQDTSAYGADIKYMPANWNGQNYKSNIYDLCVALGNLGIWVRLHYVYPYPHVDKLIPLMSEGKLLPYLDVPLQHGSPKILKLMRRPAAAEKSLERVMRWREICPEITIRSTFIVGFPGETDKDFESLVDFLEQAQLDRVGCFQYSPVEGASANKLQGSVDDHIKEERWEHFMKIQANISREKLQKKVGKNIQVIIDNINDTNIVGRGYADAPEIDGNVYVKSSVNVDVGDLLTVNIDRSDDYDLWGTETSANRGEG